MLLEKEWKGRVRGLGVGVGVADEDVDVLAIPNYQAINSKARVTYNNLAQP